MPSSFKYLNIHEADLNIQCKKKKIKNYLLMFNFFGRSK